MKTTYAFLAVVAILGYNSFLIKRDAELFKAYDKVCQEQPHHPDCKYSK
jgi:hypothetical protein